MPPPDWAQKMLCIIVPNRRTGGAPPPPPLPTPEMTFGFLIHLVFCKKKKSMWFIGVEVEQETSAPPPKKILDPRLC